MTARLLDVRKAISTLLMCCVMVSAHVVAQPRVDRDAFTFDLPVGWALLNNDGHKDFDNFNFHNVRGEVIQFGVSKKLSMSTYARAKNNLRAGLSKDQSDHGWALVRAGSFNLYPYGEFDEAIYVDKASKLTSFSYNVYGTDRIAVFTLTFKGEIPTAVNEARRLVSGLKWK